jgi:hypothetical protein
LRLFLSRPGLELIEQGFGSRRVDGSWLIDFSPILKGSLILKGRLILKASFEGGKQFAGRWGPRQGLSPSG